MNEPRFSAELPARRARAASFVMRAALYLATISGPAWAEPPVEPPVPVDGEPELATDRRAAAEVLFEQALTLIERGNLSAGCAKLEASEQLDPAVGTLLHLGNCYEQNGQLASAWARFREARSLAAAQRMPERERIAELRASALERRLTRVTIDVPARLPRGFAVRLGGTVVPAASWGVPLPLDAGTRLLEASAPGYEPYVRRVTVSSTEGSLITLQVPALRPKPPEREVARTASVDTGDTARAVGVTLMVVGGASLATSGVLTILAARRNHESMAHCPTQPTRCSARGVELREDAGTFADYATLSAAAGGALGLAGVVTYLVAPRAHERERVTVSLAPAVGPGGLSLAGTGVF